MKTICIFNSKMYGTLDSAVSVIAEHRLVSGVVGVYNAETGDFMRKVTVNRHDDYTYSMYALFEGYESDKDGEYLYNMYSNTEQCYNTYEEVRELLSTVKSGVYRISCVEKTVHRYHSAEKTVIMLGDCYPVEDIIIKTYDKRGDKHGF